MDVPPFPEASVLGSELEAEQAFIDHAYERLAAQRAAAERWRDSVLALGRGTPQAVDEREVIVRSSLRRIQQLDIGDESLVFGRIDRETGESFHIGRVAVSSEDHEPVVVDWRAPAAEAFYRATGRHPLGLVLRRHLATDGRSLVGFEDERFAGDDGDLGLAGTGALLAALERTRTGQMRDIVATVQREQDEVIRSDLEGVLVVQGGPGTGKTAVALHRAAYLLFTHRARLERQGVLFVGPNPVFLRYIDRVLPALGESGAELSTVAGLVAVPGIVVRGTDTQEAARVKSDVRMVTVLARAVADRQRRLSSDATLSVAGELLTVTVEDSAGLVGSVKRRRGTHNERRRQLFRLLVAHLHRRLVESTAAAGILDSGVTIADLEGELRGDPQVRHLLDRMWPLIRPQEVLNDLFGVPALIRSAGRAVLAPHEMTALERPRSRTVSAIAWTPADVALLDELHGLLGTRRAVRRDGDGGSDLFAHYGHIVVDEAQDLSPMALRMLARRSVNGSMTIVGDIAQATGPWAPADWADVLAHLPTRRGTRTALLGVNYRTPAEIMDFAARVLRAVAPDLRGPRSVRSTGRRPVIRRTSADQLPSEVARVVAAELEAVRPGTVAVLCDRASVDNVSRWMAAGGLEFAEATRRGVGPGLSLVPVDVVKGLEFDGVVVVEPDRVVGQLGLRGLYVALTRATRRLVVVHARPLPAGLAG